MPSFAKFELFDKVEILKDLEGLSPQGRSAALAQFATVEIAKADAVNQQAFGNRIPYDTFVDGRPSRNLSTVRPDGTIVAEWKFGVEIVDWIYRTLREKAPVLKGEYRDSITIFADGVAVGTPKEAEGADQVFIMATVPYARKLEGVSDKKYMSKQAPDGIFQVVANTAKRRFGNQAKILYTFRGISGMTSHIEAWATRRSAKNARKVGSAKARRQYDKDVRNPAILIMFK